MKQKTIAKETSLKGVGLHTGKEVSLTFKPAEINTGFVFCREDLEGSPCMPALAQYVTRTERSTILSDGDLEIHTSEHVLAALTGMDLDNILICLDSEEPPIMDGSSIQFVNAIEEAGIVEQDAEQEVFEVTEIIEFKDENTGSELILLPHDSYEINVMVDFGSNIIGTQNASITDISQFKDEIADSRTFSFLHEIEMLLDNGLIKGGDLNNAIIYVDKELSDGTMEKLKTAFNKEQVAVKPNGILDNLNLHYPNEAARHKLLDVIGDLSLVGSKIKGKLIAIKPGHHVNTEFAKKISKHIKDSKRNRAPQIDWNNPPLMDVTQIMNMLPHRPPFLLIDRIYELTTSRVVGTKSVTMNEDFFVGHFPGAPVMPGVLQVEAMAQTGGILVLSTVPDPENYLTFFMKMDNVKFKQPVVPGDTLVFDCELITPIRRGICHMKANAYVNDKLVSEAELMAQIIKKK